MKQFNILKGTKGWLTMYRRVVRFRYMRNQKEVERRIKILDFWKALGLDATRDAFSVSRRTLFRWQAALDTAKGKVTALDPQRTAPIQRRKRIIPEAIATCIVAERAAHPRFGKKKLVLLLREAGHRVSESYVGRAIHDLKEQGRLPSGKQYSFSARTGIHHEKRHVKRRKLRRVHKRGMELDTIVRFIDGVKRYILTAIDVERKFAFAGAYTSHSSAAAADFLKKLMLVVPFPIDELQTDNGSEFAKHFEQACATLNLIHFHTYPRSPKMNPFIERFNRTLSEDFIETRRALLRDDPAAFNEELVDWLIWYNTVRPHESLGQVSPLRYIVSTLTAKECQKYWTRTRYLQASNYKLGLLVNFRNVYLKPIRIIRSHS
jgi:transposase InsO family protein